MSEPNQAPQRDFDLVDIPVEGVAAYWLSIKKLVGSRRGFEKTVAQEAEYTSEPFVRYLLDAAFSISDEALARQACEARRDLLLGALGMRLELMRAAVLDVAVGENPRKSAARMMALFARAPMPEAKAFHMAQELYKLSKRVGGADTEGSADLASAEARPSAEGGAAGSGSGDTADGVERIQGEMAEPTGGPSAVAAPGAEAAAPAQADDKARFFNVDHRTKADQLLVILLFYVLQARHEGRAACRGFLPYCNSAFFADGMALVVDGFDAPFVHKRMGAHKEALLADVGLKMRLCLDMCRAIRSRLDYEDVFRVAKAYL